MLAPLQVRRGSTDLTLKRRPGEVNFQLPPHKRSLLLWLKQQKEEANWCHLPRFLVALRRAKKALEGVGWWVLQARLLTHPPHNITTENSRGKGCTMRPYHLYAGVTALVRYTGHRVPLNCFCWGPHVSCQPTRKSSNEVWWWLKKRHFLPDIHLGSHYLSLDK